MKACALKESSPRLAVSFVYDLCEEFARLAETRLAQKTLSTLEYIELS